MTIPVELDVEDLLTPTSDAARLDHLRAEGLDDETGLDWVLDRAEELVHDDPRAAEELGELCDRAATAPRGEGLVTVRARAAYLRARVLTERGALEAGLALIEQARRHWEAAGRPTDALRTDLGRMQILDDLGRHADALAVGEALLAEVEKVPAGTPDHPLARRVRATAWENVGAALGLTGRHEEALAAYAQAEDGYRGLGLLADTARPRGNRGIELLALGRPREAMTHLRAAVTLLEEDGDRLYAALCQGWLAQAHHQLGELTQALAVLEPARATLDALGARPEADRLQLAIAQTYLAAGLLGEARHAAGLAAERTARGGLVHDAAVAQFVVAEAALGEQDAAAASAALERAMALFDEVEDAQHQARCRLVQAEVAMLLGDRTGAQQLAERAAAALAAGGWRVPLAWARLRQADLADDPASAARWLSEAGALVDELALPALTYQHRVRLARRARADGRTAEAEALLTGLLADLRQVSHALPDHALRTAFRADKAAAYDDLVDLLVDRAAPDDLERAREVSDSAKAQTLRDLVSDSVGTGPDVTAYGSALARVHTDLGAAYLALQHAEAADRAALRRQVDGLEQQVAALRLREAAQPGPSATAAAPLDADAPGLTSLEFHVLGPDVVVFAAVGGRLTVRRLRGIVPALQAGLDGLGDQWSRFLLGSAFQGRHAELLRRTTTQLLQHLYDLLLRPVEDVLGAAPGARLHIVPHRLVGQLPLQALHDGRRHLLERFVLTISPTRPRSQESGPPSGALTRPLVVAASDAAAPAVAGEARAVAGLLPRATLLLDDQATAAGVRAALPGATLVHLACHGLYRAANPLFSRLRLADRWVTSAEIIRLDLARALVVLSACESGQHGRAAEPVGLGWAFLAAGASGVVASQWVVHDATTSALMTRFYEHLNGGSDPALALQQAQLATAEQHPHPYYWAPFTYVASPSHPPRSTS